MQGRLLLPKDEESYEISDRIPEKPIGAAEGRAWRTLPATSSIAIRTLVC